MADISDTLPNYWVRWHGGECPVPPYSKPGIIIRGFARWHLCQMPGGPEADEAQNYLWQHGGPDNPVNIIAYLPEEPRP